VLAGAPYAVPVERVREIVRLRTVTPMPRTPDWLRGVISLRGEVVQVVDLRMRLGLACSEPTRKSRIIVLHGDEEDRLAGVLVDAVREVLRVAPDAICPSTSSDLMAVQEMCRNGDEFVSILDLERALEPHGEV
jgi:purine-binding chemotaxis protein CheW